MEQYKNELFLEITTNLNLIPVEKFIGFLQEGIVKNHKLLKILNLLDFIHEYRKIVSNNITFSSQYNEIVQNLINILKYNVLFKKKESLLKNLELTEQHKKSSDITAINDLVKKLNESLTNNKNKLGFLEEDYFQWKNQVDQIKKTINQHNLKIQELTKRKKKYFSQINSITREMEGDTQELKKELIDKASETNSNLTNAEKIKNFQKKAKEIQYEINNIKSKISQTQIKLDELNPIFEIYKNDYQVVLEMITKEEEKIIDLQSELKNKIKDNEIVPVQDLDLNDFKSLRSSLEIEEEIKKVDAELNNIVITDDMYNLQKPGDLSSIIAKLSELDEKTKNHESEIIINVNENEISECFEQFRKFEIIINEIAFFINKFLPEINLKSHFRILISSDDKEFFIDIKFIRNDKERVNFDELTTPEKIFFIIIFYISVKLHIRNEKIIFSNVSILSKYNKAGSIYRTIRKILPIFEMEDVLSKFNLVFIISNLELQKEIKNLKIKTL